MCLIGSLPFFFPQTVLEPKEGNGKGASKNAIITKSAMVEFENEGECAWFLMTYDQKHVPAIGPAQLQASSL